MRSRRYYNVPPVRQQSLILKIFSKHRTNNSLVHWKQNVKCDFYLYVNAQIKKGMLYFHWSPRALFWTTHICDGPPKRSNPVRPFLFDNVCRGSWKNWFEENPPKRWKNSYKNLPFPELSFSQPSLKKHINRRLSDQRGSTTKIFPSFLQHNALLHLDFVHLSKFFDLDKQ